MEARLLPSLSWAHLGAIWGYLGTSWGSLGISWGHLGLSWGLFGAILEPLWSHLGSLVAILGPSWGHLGELSRPNAREAPEAKGESIQADQRHAERIILGLGLEAANSVATPYDAVRNSAEEGDPLLLWPCWDHVGTILRPFGAIWGCLGPLGAFLEPPWGAILTTAA